MKRRIISILLACALTLGLAVPALAAENFTDLKGHWAEREIMALAARGLFQGYGDGRVGPNDKVVNSAALALCARMSVRDEDVRLQIGADRYDEVSSILPSGERYAWFEKEAATCLEMGIVTYTELTNIAWTSAATGENALNADTTRGDFAKYVVRAMGLEDMARLLSGSDLSCADADEIPGDLRPYVKLLYQWGVVNGVNEPDGLNYFHPNQSITRAECAAMLERAIEKMEARGVSVEIPRYSKYKWASGYIADVNVLDAGARKLTLRSPFRESELTDVTLPAGTKVYLYNKLDEFTALRVGYFARVCYASDGVTAESVRVLNSDLLTHVAGSCDELGPNEVVVDGTPYAIDRFTQVSASGKTGDASVIDFDAAYTGAELVSDASGHAIHLSLTGGTRRLEGILTDVTVEPVASGTRTTITVTGYNGSGKVYQVPGTVEVLVSGLEGTLKETYEGRHVTLRVKDDDLTALQSVEVNAVDKYFQGVLRGADAKSAIHTVDVADSVGGKITRYELAGDCEVSYQGKAATLESLTGNVFITGKVVGGSVTWLAGYPGYDVTTGTLRSITYEDPTVLVVTLSDGTSATFSIPTANLSNVTITRDGKESTISQLQAGDEVEVTVLYNAVSQIDATAQAANITGTVDSITQNADGTAQLVLRFVDGSTAAYNANSATTVTRDGVSASLASIHPNDTVAMVTDGDRALSIDAKGATQSRDQISGSIYAIDAANRLITLLIRDEATGATRLQDVYIPYNLSVYDVPTGTTVSGLNRLKVNEILRVWGSYDAKGRFTAASAIREG